QRWPRSLLCMRPTRHANEGQHHQCMDADIASADGGTDEKLAQHFVAPETHRMGSSSLSIAISLLICKNVRSSGIDINYVIGTETKLILKYTSDNTPSA